MAKMNWIPASDPPETQEDILFIVADGAVFRGYYNGQCYADMDGNEREEVEWWMPIPPLPDNSPGWRHMW